MSNNLTLTLRDFIQAMRPGTDQHLENQIFAIASAWGDIRARNKEDEIAVLRHYGNKGCTAQADEYLEECREAGKRPFQE